MERKRRIRRSVTGSEEKVQFVKTKGGVVGGGVLVK